MSYKFLLFLHNSAVWGVTTFGSHALSCMVHFPFTRTGTDMLYAKEGTQAQFKNRCGMLLTNRYQEPA